MAKPLNLTPEEKKLATEIRSALKTIKSQIGHGVPPGAIDALGQKAHELHMLLKKRGHEPRHSSAMMNNREAPPVSPKFYQHIHPVEDLLSFLADQHANDDPVDVTIGGEFTFPVHSRRWGHRDSYRIRRTHTGWNVGHMQQVAAGPDARVAGKDGTGLFAMLDHDSINYPEALPRYFEYLWEQAADQGLTSERVQKAITGLADWVSACEKASPGGIFKAYK